MKYSSYIAMFVIGVPMCRYACPSGDGSDEFDTFNNMEGVRLLEHSDSLCNNSSVSLDPRYMGNPYDTHIKPLVSKSTPSLRPQVKACAKGILPRVPKLLPHRRRLSISKEQLYGSNAFFGNFQLPGITMLRTVRSSQPPQLPGATIHSKLSRPLQSPGSTVYARSSQPPIVKPIPLLRESFWGTPCPTPASSPPLEAFPPLVASPPLEASPQLGASPPRQYSADSQLSSPSQISSPSQLPSPWLDNDNEDNLEFELVNVPDEYDVKNDKDNPFASASARSIMSTSQRGHSRQRLSSIFSPLSLAIDFLQGEQKKIEEQGVCESPKTLCDVYVLLSLFDRLSFFGVYWIMEEFIPYLKYANIIGFSYGAAIAAAIKTNLTGSDFLSHFEKLSAENSNDKLNLNKIMVLMSDENTATSNGEPTQMIGFETESYADTIKSMFGNIEKNRIKHLAIITNDKVSSSISSSSISSSSASSSSISSSSISSSSVSSSSASSSSISSSSVSSSSVSSSEESEYDKLYAGTNANLLSYHVIRSITSYTLENIKKYKLVVADDYLREIMKHSHKADAVVLNVYTNYSPEPNSTSVSVYPSSTLSSKGCEILRIDICLCIAEDERSLENIKEKIDQKRSSSGINEIYENLVKFLEPWHNGIISYKKGGSLPRSV